MWVCEQQWPWELVLCHPGLTGVGICANSSVSVDSNAVILVAQPQLPVLDCLKPGPDRQAECQCLPNLINEHGWRRKMQEMSLMATDAILQLGKLL